MSSSTDVKIVVADPSAIGLLGLAMVTLVASAAKFGMISGLGLVIPWVLFLGATAQMLACVNDLKHNNVFGATAFGGYAFFWYGVGMSWMIQMGTFGAGLQAAADPKALAFAFLGYTIFSLYMTIGSIETNKVLLIIFVLIDILLLCLTLSSFGIMAHTTHMIGAWTEMAISMMSFYGSAANVLNKHFGYEFLPVGKPMGIFKKPAAAKLQTA